MSRYAPVRQGLAALAIWGLAALTTTASAAGYHVLKADVHSAQNSAGTEETGFGLSLYSDEFATRFSYGAPAGEARRLQDAWFAGSWWGPAMGVVPDDFADLEQRYDELASKRFKGLMPYRFWRLGSNAEERRAFSWDWSTHSVYNLPGILGADHRRLLFGPTAGIGLNLTWWDRWRDNPDKIINTGKITGEAGWVAGFASKTAYAQARLTAGVDLFGQNQWNANLATIAGVVLSRIPFGLEFQGEWTRGNDTVDLTDKTVWRALVALQFRVLPDQLADAEEEQKLRELMEMLPELEAAMERKQTEEQQENERRRAIERETLTEDNAPSEPLPINTGTDSETAPVLAEEQSTDTTPQTSDGAKDAPQQTPDDTKTDEEEAASETSETPPTEGSRSPGPSGPDL